MRRFAAQRHLLAAPIWSPAADRDLYGAPLLVLANKHDVDGAASPAELAEVLGISQLDGGRASSVQAVTARTGEGVKPAVQWLVQHIKKSQRPELIRRRMLSQ
jgi:ADP-ribosylation factor related protein 1